jgi:hypothetical protein
VRAACREERSRIWVLIWLKCDMARSVINEWDKE